MQKTRNEYVQKPKTVGTPLQNQWLIHQNYTGGPTQQPANPQLLMKRRLNFPTNDHTALKDVKKHSTATRNQIPAKTKAAKESFCFFKPR
jgi:hypothetical protein